MGDVPKRRNWRAYGDAILFLIGATGAVWEIFVDQTNNLYVFALIIVFVRAGRDGLDVIKGWFPTR